MTCEITQLVALLVGLGLKKEELLPVDLYCDNEAALSIVSVRFKSTRTQEGGELYLSIFRVSDNTLENSSNRVFAVNQKQDCCGK